jgi:hypothetical protein
MKTKPFGVLLKQVAYDLDLKGLLLLTAGIY